MPLPKDLQLAAIIVGKRYVSKNKFDEALDKIKSLVMIDDPKPRTISNRFSLFKKEMQKYTNNKEFLKKVRPPDVLTRQLIKENLRIRDVDKLRKTITKKEIDTLMNLQFSQDPYQIALFLLFCSGRRNSELIENRFSEDPETDDLILVSGLKKKRGAGPEFETFKPICPREEFLNLLTRVENLRKSTFNTLLNRRIKKIFTRMWTVHLLRSVYANYIFHFDNPTDKKINQSIKESLNHSAIESSLSYTGIKFSSDIVSSA